MSCQASRPASLAKAYPELEAEEVFLTPPGKGSVLNDNHSPLKESVRQELLSKAIDQAIVRAQHLQISSDEFLGLVRERLNQFRMEAQDAARKEEK